MREWSHYQQAIFDAVQSTSSSIVVTARAGSGKTTTLVEATQRAPIRGRMAVVAFANRSKEKVTASLPPNSPFEVSTIHSMGLAMLQRVNRRVSVDTRGEKLRRLVVDEVGRSDLREPVERLVRAAKAHLVDDAPGLERLFVRERAPEEIELDPKEIAGLAKCVLYMCRETDDVVDFDDMVWLPVQLGLRGTMSYRFLCVDELQDLSYAQVKLVCLVNEGRVLGVGDPAQALYGFANAADDAVGELVRALGPDTIKLPLSISYRCAKAVVQEARRYVRDIESAPTAPDGLVVQDSNLSRVKSGDLVLSRANAPLLKLCLDAVKKGIPAYIAGRKLADYLLRCIDRSEASTPEGLRRWVIEWHRKETEEAKDDAQALQRIDDHAKSLLAISDGAASLTEIRKRIERLFSESRGSVVFSTVHQMKGEEASRVFVLRDTFRAGTPNELRNLMYVAVTRARNELHYVSGEM